MEVTEVRCPTSFGRLFVKLRQDGLPPKYVLDNTAMEFACPECRRERGSKVRLVLHRYNLVGELVETVTEFADGSTEVVPGAVRSS